MFEPGNSGSFARRLVEFTETKLMRQNETTDKHNETALSNVVGVMVLNLNDENYLQVYYGIFVNSARLAHLQRPKFYGFPALAQRRGTPMYPLKPLGIIGCLNLHSGTWWAQKLLAAALCCDAFVAAFPGFPWANCKGKFVRVSRRRLTSR